jgi:hypothetical protein
MADLSHYHRINLTDLVTGVGGWTPRLVLGLLAELPEDAATVASIRGGDEWRGWTRGTGVLADLYDALNVNTRATGQWKRKPPKIDPYPRPEQKKAGKKKRRGQSIADVRRTLGIPTGPPQQ